MRSVSRPRKLGRDLTCAYQSCAGCDWLQSTSPMKSSDDRCAAAVKSAGARVEPLPPYSPNETPIEELFSKVKTYLRQVAARTKEAVMQSFGDALNLVTTWDCIGWFVDRCAYAFH